MTIYLIDAAVGVAIGFGTFLAGIAIGRRRVTSLEICQCRHGSAFHEADGCLQDVKRNIYMNGWEYFQCPCVRYVGPNTSYVPELDAL